MPPDHDVSRSCILRVAGLPIRLWQRAGNPALFAAIRELAAVRRRYQGTSRALADDLGRDLVCAEGISRADRGLALELRRRLHNGRQVLADESLGRLVEVAAAAGLDAASWGERLREAAETSRRITELHGLVDATLEAEPGRLAEQAWVLCRDVPAVRGLMMHRSPEVLRSLEQRAARGERWGGKSARRSAELVWRVLRRASTKSNPRDWHGHVGLLPVVEGCSPRDVPRVEAEVWAQWIENAHGQRRDLTGAPITATPGVRLAVTPLHWRTDQQLWAWAVDRDDPRRLVEVKLRRTAYLDAIHQALSAGSVPVDELAAAVLDDPADPEARDVLYGFVEHLVELGVLEPSSTPCSWMLGPLPMADRATPAAAVVDARIRGGRRGDEGAGASVEEHRMARGFLDVYRGVSGSVSLAEGLRLQELVAQVQRLLLLIEDDRHHRHEDAGGDRGPIALLEALRPQVLEPSAPERRAPSLELHWPPARDEGSGYGRLLAFIARQVDRGASVVDIDARRLDECGAWAASFDWPVDCMLRLPARGTARVQGVEAVLDELLPAGALDARFVGALHRLHGRVPHTEGYRRFLQRVEEITGVTILELLIPPLSLGAANATKRPLLTRAFTGDADVGMYVEGARPDGLRYVPLEAITWRRAGGRNVVEALGRRVWPIYHATRRPLPPWSTIADVLLWASPLSTAWVPRRLHLSLDAFPERRAMPRITIGGGLLVAGAQWRLTEAPWDRGASLRTKLEGLQALRSRLGLPRWLFVASGELRKPLACDLESMLAVRVIEDAVERPGGAVLVEMLPAPSELLVTDPGSAPHDGCVSSVMLRFPYDEPPEALAERVAARLRATALDH